MQGKWLLAACLVMAGCAEQPPKEEVAVQGPWNELLPVDEDYGLRRGTVCTSAFCEGGSDARDAPRFFVEANASVQGFNLTLDSGEELPEGMAAVLEVDCEPGPRGCGSRLRQRVEGDFPLHLQAEGLEFPPGVILRLFAYLEGSYTPLVGIFTEEDIPGHLTGTVSVLIDPILNVPPPMVLELAVAHKGNAGICTDQDQCSIGGGPRGTPAAYGPLDGPIVGLDIVVSWSADTDISKSMVLEAWCRIGSTNSCSDYSFEAMGSSPIHLNVSGFETRADAYYEFYVYLEGPGSIPFGTGQEYHVEGVIRYLAPGDTP